MHGLLGIDPAEPRGAGHSEIPRLIVIKRDGQTWVFEAEEVFGVHRFTQSLLSNVPSTLANPANSFSQAVLNWRNKTIGFLDDQRVFVAASGG